MEHILEPTNGVILYQEQVMQIAQELAGYSLGDADLLRRAMGKKKPEEMAKQRQIFVNGAVANEVDEDTANYIFDQMETFAGYGFNKSHSAAYALLSYQTAWLKAHHPAAFMGAVLSADMDHTDKIAVMIDECRGMGLTVEQPDINRSVHAFAAIDDERIRYGLGALKGLGRGAIESILAERESAGPFTDLLDFCGRVDLQRVNKRALEALIRSGAMDPLEEQGNRARLLSALVDVLRVAEQAQRDRESGQTDLFGASEGKAPAVAYEMPPAAPWPELQQLYAEKEALGLFLTGHPAKVHRYDTRRFTTCPIGRLRKLVPRPDNGRRAKGVDMVLAGLVCAVRRANRSGRFVTIEDHTGRLEVALFDEAFGRYADLLGKDDMVVVEGKVTADDFSGGYRMSASRVMSLGEAKARFARGVRISLCGPEVRVAELLSSAFAPYRDGVGRVYVDYRNQRARASLELGAEWQVKPCEELVAALEGLEPVTAAQLVY